MLTALAFGARELASLPVPPSAVPQERLGFPSNRLPLALHQKLLPGNPVQRLLVDISQKMIDGSTESTTERVPQLVRERHLRLQKTPRIIPAGAPTVVTQSTPPFTEIAAECFICPLINRFWLFLRDEQSREARSSLNKDQLYRYRGAGTGLILNPVVLCQFLSTLGVLVHAARNAVQWLAVIAPGALELAVTIGTKPMSKVEDEGDGEDDDEGGGRGKEAAVLCTAFELAVVVLDGCLELDGGKSLGLEHTSLVLGAGEWAGKLLTQLEKGVLVSGGGGAQEVRLRRAAAGVVLKVDELTSKWRRSMIDVF
jgi:telomere length regulation protein